MRIYWVIVILLAVAACAPQAEPTAAPPTPTAEEVTPEPSATPLELRRPTLPPTWTPSPEVGGQAQAQNVDVTPHPEGQPTQPPAGITQFAPATPLDVCNTFGEDRELNRRTFKIGESPQVFWTAVEGAASYSVSLIDETGQVVLTEYTVEPTITFDATLFEEGKLYGWEAYPIDALGQQMCLGRGAELFPEDPLAVPPSS